jgi:hypothetical protein
LGSWTDQRANILQVRAAPAFMFFGVQKNFSSLQVQPAAEKIFLDNIRTTANQQQKGSSWTTSEQQPTTTNHNHRPNPATTTGQPPEPPNNTPTKIQPKTLINIDFLKNLKKKYTPNY